MTGHLNIDTEQVRPNFFLVGAMKSGSSTLTQYLRSHPQIYMARKPKEPSFFLTKEQLLDVYPVMEGMGFYRDEEKYLQLFTQGRGCRVVGEASQNYARLSRVTGVSDRIYSYNPDARILYILRDPIERTISHYWYMVELYGENRTMLDAIRSDVDYTDTSYYAMQIRPYLELFGSDKVMIITLEELRDKPALTMRQVFQWLGVDPEFELPAVAKRNVTPEAVTMSRPGNYLTNTQNTSLWRAISRRIPPGLKSFLRRFSKSTVIRKNISTVEVTRYLRPLQEEQTKELEKILKKKFTKWNTLRPAVNSALDS